MNGTLKVNTDGNVSNWIKIGNGLATVAGGSK